MQGVATQKAMKEMQSPNDQQTAAELEKVLYDREEKLRLVRQEKKSIHNDLLKEKERREKTEALATKLQKKLSEVSKMADPALIARAKEIIAANHSGSGGGGGGSSSSSSSRQEEPAKAQPTASDVTRSAHTPTHHGNQGHLQAKTPPTISKSSFAATAPSLAAISKSSTTALKTFSSGANKPRTVNHHM